MALYDYIYVDLQKVISVYSQITGGVVEVFERSSERSRSADNKRNYDFKIFRHDAGGTDVDTSASKEIIKPHHALLQEMEDALAKDGYLVDLTDQTASHSLRDSILRSQLKETFCVKVSGRAVIEDYERIKAIADTFPDVVKLINKSAESNLLKSEQYADIKRQIEAAEVSAKSVKDRNAKSKDEHKIKFLKHQLSTLVDQASRVNLVDQWILDGVKTWIDSFLPGIVNLRIYPDVNKPDEHIFGHLKKHCFEDIDTSSFHFTYGSFPTELLTMIGIVTSVPEETGEQFKPLAEFENRALADYEAMESAFRGVFRGFDGLEQMIRTCRYPRVLVLPITVYRSATPKGERYK